jgi:hypothetical protein
MDSWRPRRERLAVGGAPERWVPRAGTPERRVPGAGASERWPPAAGVREWWPPAASGRDRRPPALSGCERWPPVIERWVMTFGCPSPKLESSMASGGRRLSWLLVAASSD